MEKRMNFEAGAVGQAGRHLVPEVGTMPKEITE